MSRHSAGAGTSRTGSKRISTIAIFNFAANYFGSEYFFDVLGMVYDYPMIELTFDSALVGSGEQRVPLIMYLLTQAYFITLPHDRGHRAPPDPYIQDSD